MRKSFITLVVAVTLASSGFMLVGCAHPAPNTTPEASSASKRAQVQSALDFVRDVAQQENANKSPLFPDSVTLKITTWHEQATIILKASSVGWQVTVNASLDALVADLPADVRAKLLPFTSVVKAVILEFGA